MPRDLLPKTECANCGDVIEAGEYRVVVMAVEMKPEDDDGVEVPAGRGESNTGNYCDRCAADLPEFVMRNIWKDISDARAEPSAGPQSEDAYFRRETGNGGIGKKKTEPENDEANLSAADRENIKFSDWVGPGQAAIKGDVPLTT